MRRLPRRPIRVLQPLLDPVAGWYMGSGEALDSRHIDRRGRHVRRLRSWPSRWQRPLVAAPAEHWRSYAALVDAIIDDLPIRNRGHSAAAKRSPRCMKHGCGWATASNRPWGSSACLPKRCSARPSRSPILVGAPRPISFRWHSMWVQTMRSLEVDARGNSVSVHHAHWPPAASWRHSDRWRSATSIAWWR